MSAAPETGYLKLAHADPDAWRAWQDSATAEFFLLSTVVLLIVAAGGVVLRSLVKWFK